MKKIIISLTLSLLVFSCFATERTITVSAISKVSIPVNTFELRLLLKTVSPELEKSVDLNNSSLEKLKQQVENLKLKDVKIQISQYKHGKNYKRVDREQIQDGFYTSRKLIIKFEDAESYTQVTYAIASIEDVSIESTDMNSTKLLETKSKARKEAIVTARVKAEEMAKALEMAVGTPIMINANALDQPRFMIGHNSYSLSEADTDYQNVTIEESVVVTFEMIPIK